MTKSLNWIGEFIDAMILEEIFLDVRINEYHFLL